MSNNKLICIDPGHGGRDPGALGLNETKESELNLAVATRLHDLLTHAYSGKAVLTRAADSALTLADRVERANMSRAYYFVSLHMNSAEVEAKGFEVWVHPEANEAEVLGQNILEFLAERMPNEPNRGLKYSDSLYVLSQTRMPACLVEFGFLNDPWFSEWIKLTNSKNSLAWAVARGIIKTIYQKKGG